ncbi:MarR family winged helix-turn-helix transcriptional regulator [Pseudonocardia sichuanensis]|uniref:DNA-binding MarR family transcriptional regulator n=1 Tax=Pseudonocardia kunmingensis TaxID=630975 RepID=A0A543D0Y3_9PSEU|nr:MarR family transcriptional regulator [Pseudonocardia kunmingensis]TQM02961.1 DNA-binding MarR family transcriptional regulator [Pseudonocardia kunmingensis]
MSTPGPVESDLGWALGAVMRSYLRATTEAVGDVPGGPRGYQVLSAAAGEPRSQLALAQHLGVDRTVMTYLLDDLERAGLVERRPDPADRRVRRVVLTDQGGARLCELERRLAAAEERLLDPLGPAERDHLRHLLRVLATRTTHGEDPCTVVEEARQELAEAGPAPRRVRG